jgi:hypothetical protein
VIVPKPLSAVVPDPPFSWPANSHPSDRRTKKVAFRGHFLDECSVVVCRYRITGNSEIGAQRPVSTGLNFLFADDPGSDPETHYDASSSLGTVDVNWRAS